MLLHTFTMSLQKIFESARKLGVPVIVTDPAGREPLVILPLEQFEAMASEGSSRIPVEKEVNQALAEMTAERLKIRVEEAAVQFEAPAEIEPENPNFSLEERFYLEPVEDKETD